MTKSAPGKSYRKGISLVEAIKRFSNEADAEAWFMETRWASGIVCPFCGGLDGVRERKNRKPQPFRCKDCRKDFSIKTGTLMQGSKLPLGTWAIAFYLFSTHLKGVSSMKLHRDLAVTQKTAWHLAHRIRETLKDNPGQFFGPVEIDETYIGGKEGNKHQDKKLNAGRGPVGKSAVVGARDQDTGQIAAKHIPFTDKDALQGFVRETTEIGAVVYTDEARAYEGMPHRSHWTVQHSAGEYVKRQATTNGIESFWALLKRGINGTYHHVSSKHLGRYVTEFSGRHNSRPMDTEAIMGRMARGTTGKRLPYAGLIGPAFTRQPQML